MEDRDLSPVEARAAETGRLNLTFEQRFEEICWWIDKRRRGLDLVTLDWEDCRSELIEHVWKQFPSFDPERGEFRNWVNWIISNKIRNIYRDNLAKWSRPCITGKGGCADNMGGTLCRRTPSGVQCSECPAYREWEQKKGAQFAIMQPLPLDVPVDGDSGHVVERQEISNTQADFLDYQEQGARLHALMRKRLTKKEWKAYKMLVIQHRSPEDVGKALGFRAKRGKKQRMFPGYLAVLAMRHRFVEEARKLLKEEDLAA